MEAKNMRTKKVFLNMIADTLPYLLIGIVGILKVNILIRCIGDVGNGYYQFINQVITYVFLAQCGFTDAVIYKLYKPFAEDNKEDINAIYSGSRLIFKRIGCIIFGIILIVTTLLYFFGSFEAGYRIQSLACFFIISCSYLIPFFFKKQAYQAIVSAAQEKYLYTFPTNIIKLCCDILTIISVLIFKNLIAIALTIFIVKIIEEVILEKYIERKYPWVKEISRKDTSSTKMIKDLAWYQIGYLVTNNTDSILLMYFLGPISVSIYTSYNYILRFLNEIISRINNAAIYSFGNVFAKKENDKAYGLYKEYLSGFIIIAFTFCLTFLIGIRSFVLNTWIKDMLYNLDYVTICLFTSTLFFTTIYFPLYSMINSNGLFKDNKRHVLISAVINIVFSLLLIKPFGINGILLATALSFIINLILKCLLAKKKIFPQVSLFSLITPYVISSLICIMILFFIKPVELFLLNHFKNFIGIICILGISFILIGGITTSIMYLIDSNTKLLVKRVIRLLKRKLKKSA